MKKKIICLLIASIMIIPMVGCNSNKNEKVNKENKTVEVNKDDDKKDKDTADNDKAANEDKNEKEINVSEDEMVEKYNKYMAEFEKNLNADGYPVYKSDKAKGGVLGDDYISYEIGNRTKELYKVYNCSMDVLETKSKTAVFEENVEYPIDRNDVVNGKKVDVKNMGFEKYAQILLPDHQWDYEAINKEINDILINLESVHKTAGVFEEKGCKVTFSVYPDNIRFKMYSPMYIFK